MLRKNLKLDTADMGKDGKLSHVSIRTCSTANRERPLEAAPQAPAVSHRFSDAICCATVTTRMPLLLFLLLLALERWQTLLHVTP